MTTLRQTPSPARARHTARKDSVLTDWLSSTDHKVIGHMYLITSFVFFLCGGIMALLTRIQLLGPDPHVMSDQQHARHDHALLLFATPLFVGFAGSWILARVTRDRAGHPGNQRTGSARPSSLRGSGHMRAAIAARPHRLASGAGQGASSTASDSLRHRSRPASSAGSGAGRASPRLRRPSAAGRPGRAEPRADLRPAPAAFPCAGRQR